MIGAVTVATYTKGNSVKLSNNFFSNEFDCKCGKCNKTIIDADLVYYLQLIRDHYKKPVIINSGYRCAKHNKAVGGATLSKHRFGMAADIKIKDVPPKAIAAHAEKIGMRGIGLYSSFVHIDTRRNKSFWYGDKQEKRSTFISTDLRAIAEGVIDGKYGNGAERKRKLSALGYDYKEVQALVNELLRK